MHLFALLFCLISWSSVFTEAFFLLKVKSEPILFCIKVCPLYCRPRSKRDVDMSDIYLDDDEVPWRDNWHDYPPYPYPHYPHYIYACKHPVTTTTMKPVTTTEEPTYICILCKSKCGYPPKKR